jgi:hypothetical protein
MFLQGAVGDFSNQSELLIEQRIAPTRLQLYNKSAFICVSSDPSGVTHCPIQNNPMPTNNDTPARLSHNTLPAFELPPKAAAIESPKLLGVSPDTSSNHRRSARKTGKPILAVIAGG